MRVWFEIGGSVSAGGSASSALAPASALAAWAARRAAAMKLARAWPGSPSWGAMNEAPGPPRGAPGSIQHLLGLRRGRFQNGNRCLRERVRLGESGRVELANRRFEAHGRQSVRRSGRGRACGRGGGWTKHQRFEGVVHRLECRLRALLRIGLEGAEFGEPLLHRLGIGGRGGLRLADRRFRGPFRDDGRFAAEGLHMRQGLGQRLLDLLRGGSGELPREHLQSLLQPVEVGPAGLPQFQLFDESADHDLDRGRVGLLSDLTDRVLELVDAPEDRSGRGARLAERRLEPIEAAEDRLGGSIDLLGQRVDPAPQALHSGGERVRRLRAFCRERTRERADLLREGGEVGGDRVEADRVRPAHEEIETAVEVLELPRNLARLLCLLRALQRHADILERFLEARELARRHLLRAHLRHLASESGDLPGKTLDELGIRHAGQRLAHVGDLMAQGLDARPPGSAAATWSSFRARPSTSAVIRRWRSCETSSARCRTCA